jgi:hypothetical protein
MHAPRRTLVQPRWQSLLLFSLYLPSSAHALCEAWCTNPCAMLNGDTEYECGDCDEHYECRRSTLGPRPPLRPDPPSPSPLPALDEHITAPGLQGEPPTCQRVSASELRALSYVERARVLSRPTLITGLIDNWPAMRNWSTIEGFREAFGDHGEGLRRHERGSLAHWPSASSAPDTTWPAEVTACGDCVEGLRGHKAG